MADSERYIIEDKTHRGRQYITYSDGMQWSRKVHIQTGQPIGEWGQLEATVVKEPEPLQLHLVTQWQAIGEPKHWSLYAAHFNPKGTTRGEEWQVKGDAECMHYSHASGIDLFGSPSFAWHQTLNSNLTDSQCSRINTLAYSELPPQAENRKAVKENCQGWTIRVLLRLAEEGIVDEAR